MPGIHRRRRGNGRDAGRRGAEARRAGRRFGAGGEFDRGGVGPRERARKARRDEEHDLRAGVVVEGVREETSRDRQLAQERNTIGGAPLVVADEPGQHLRLAVAQPEIGRRGAGAELVGERARGRLHRLRDVAHLEADLHVDLVLERDERLDFQLQADVEIGDRLGDEAAGRGGGGGDDRHAVADVDACLLLVLHADARIGERVGDAVLLLEREEEERIGEGELHHVRVAVVPFTQRQRAGRAGGADQADGERVGILDAELEELVAVHLHDLDLEHHFRLGEVLRGDQALRQLDRRRRVLQHEQVDFLVDEDVARLDERADHVRGLLDVGVREIEALHHELLVLALLLRRVRVDEHRVLGEHLVLERIGEHRHADRLLDGGVAQRDAGALVGAHIAIEDEIDAGGALQHLEDVPQRHLAQIERDRLGDGGPELHRGDRGLQQPLVDRALQPPRLAMLRVLGEHRPQDVLRLAGLARLHQLLGFGDERPMAPVGVDLRQARLRARVARIVRLHARIERLRLVVAPGLPQHFGLREPLPGERVAEAKVLTAKPLVTGALAHRLLEHRERLVAAPGAVVLAGLLDGTRRRGASGKEHDENERSFHGKSPGGCA